MNLRLVQSFVQVVERGSFGGAAKVLGVPTSSVSRAVSQLEAQLSARLLDRTTRRMELTAAGRTYFEHAAQGLKTLDDARERLHEQQADPRGEVRLTVPFNFDDGFLARQLAAFARLNPSIRLNITLSNKHADLLADEFDVAVRMATHLADSSLVARELGAFHVELAASKSYLERKGRPERPTDLARHDCVLLGPKAGVCRWTLVGPKGIERIEVKGAVIADDMGFTRALILEGAGVGLLPTAPGSTRVRDKRLVRVLPKHSIEGMKLFVVVQPAKKMAVRVALLRDFLVRAYGEVAFRSSAASARGV